jgi:hypothetical protein
MEILSVLMILTGALMLAHFIAFVRTRFAPARSDGISK